MATDRWRIRGFHGDFVIARRGWLSSSDLPTGAVLLSPHAASERIDALLPDAWGQGLDASMLAEIAQALGEEPMLSADGDARRRMKGVLVQAFRDGRLTISRVRSVTPNLVGQDEVEERYVEHVQRAETAWVEIVLTTDDDPSAPIAFKRYRIELPDGGVREGQLDSRGMARLSGIDPGTCQVSFPDFDGSQWRRA